MKQDIIICINVILVTLITKLVLFGPLHFLQILFSVSILLSLGTVIYLVYDTWVSKSLSKDQIKGILDRTYEDINALTAVIKDKNVKDPEFKSDEKDEKRNKELFLISLLSGIVPFAIFLYLLYKFDKNFYTNIRTNIISISIIYVVELYFSWAIVSDFKGEGLEKVRHEIIHKFLEN